MEKNNYCDVNKDLSDIEDVLDFPMLEDIVEDNIDYNSDTSSIKSEIILPKRRRMIVIECESEESQEELVDTCPSKPRMHVGDCFQRYHNMVNYTI